MDASLHDVLSPAQIIKHVALIDFLTQRAAYLRWYPLHELDATVDAELHRAGSTIHHHHHGGGGSDDGSTGVASDAIAFSMFPMAWRAHLLAAAIKEVPPKYIMKLVSAPIHTRHAGVGGPMTQATVGPTTIFDTSLGLPLPRSAQGSMETSNAAGAAAVSRGDTGMVTSASGTTTLTRKDLMAMSQPELTTLFSSSGRSTTTLYVANAAPPATSSASNVAQWVRSATAIFGTGGLVVPGDMSLREAADVEGVMRAVESGAVLGVSLRQLNAVMSKRVARDGGVSAWSGDGDEPGGEGTAALGAVDGLGTAVDAAVTAMEQLPVTISWSPSTVAEPSAASTPSWIFAPFLPHVVEKTGTSFSGSVGGTFTAMMSLRQASQGNPAHYAASQGGAASSRSSRPGSTGLSVPKDAAPPSRVRVTLSLDAASRFMMISPSQFELTAASTSTTSSSVTTPGAGAAAVSSQCVSMHVLRADRGSIRIVAVDVATGKEWKATWGITCTLKPPALTVQSKDQCVLYPDGADALLQSIRSVFGTDVATVNVNAKEDVATAAALGGDKNHDKSDFRREVMTEAASLLQPSLVWASISQHVAAVQQPMLESERVKIQPALAWKPEFNLRGRPAAATMFSRVGQRGTISSNRGDGDVLIVTPSELAGRPLVSKRRREEDENGGGNDRDSEEHRTQKGVATGGGDAAGDKKKKKERDRRGSYLTNGHMLAAGFDFSRPHHPMPTARYVAKEALKASRKMWIEQEPPAAVPGTRLKLIHEA